MIPTVFLSILVVSYKQKVHINYYLEQYVAKSKDILQSLDKILLQYK